MGVLTNANAPSFEFASLLKLAHCAKTLRAAGTDELIQECLKDILINLLSATCCAVALIDKENSFVQGVLRFEQGAGVSGCSMGADKEMMLSLFSKWQQVGEFFTQESGGVLGQSAGEKLMAVDAYCGQSINVCMYVLLCEPRKLELCRVLMEILLPALQEAICRAIEYRKASNVAVLTDRELEIIRRMKCGFGNKSIAMQLNISVNTVKSHIYNVYRKLEVNNRVEALIVAEKAGVLLS